MTTNEPVNTPKDSTKESTLSTAELTKLKGQLRAQAERTVVQRHQDEYHAEAERLFAAHGLEFTRRLSAEEKAKREMEELLKKYPHLADQISGLTGGDREDRGGSTSTSEHRADDTPAALEDDEFRPF